MPSKNTIIDVSKHGFKIMGMIRRMIRGYDSGAWFGVWFAEMQHACDHKFCIRHFWKHSYTQTLKVPYIYSNTYMYHKKSQKTVR